MAKLYKQTKQFACDSVNNAARRYFRCAFLKFSDDKQLCTVVGKNAHFMLFSGCLNNFFI
ncbi:MAG: hypothetical protein IJM09_00870 [Neisseriaceae bacterium]|nr:hypothetical protein [Neisseriaceae bacterium]